MPRRTDRHSILAVTAGVTFMASLFAAPEASATTTTANTLVGRLTVIRQHYVNDGPPIMHVADEEREIRLEWVSADGRVRFFLKDLGGRLDANYSVEDRRPGQSGHVCVGQGYPQAYQTNGRPERRWQGSLRKQFDKLLGYCEDWIAPTQRQAYVMEFSQAAADFAEALAVMKLAAIEDFGGWRRRCLKVKLTDMRDPFPVFRCLRYSAESN